jgi:hypothetical protein
MAWVRSVWRAFPLGSRLFVRQVERQLVGVPFRDAWLPLRARSAPRPSTFAGGMPAPAYGRGSAKVPEYVVRRDRYRYVCQIGMPSCTGIARVW